MSCLSANSDFAEAVRVFNEKAAALQARLSSLRTSPSDDAQAARDEVGRPWPT